jgi:hypothetical protein
MGGRALAVATALALATGVAFTVVTPTGAASSTATSPVPTGASGNQLNGVSCPSAARCFAVGQSAATASVQQWNGKTWSVVGSPKLIGSTLAAVSCASTTSCFAVGSQTVAGAKQPLVESGNGRTWSVVTVAAPSGATGGQLEAIACTSSTSCVAAGTQFVAGSTVSKTLIERWNGKQWSITASPNPSGARSPALHGVSCPHTSNCFAVGGYNTSSGALTTLIERWNGTNWSLLASPTSGAALGGELLGVSCSSTTNCVTVGESAVATDNGNAVGERWNGKTWVVAAPRSSARSVNHLSSVACTSPTNCLAVGYLRSYAPDESGASMTRVERWTGKKWVILASPNPGATKSQFSAVSCSSKNNCFAVGLATNSAFERSLSSVQTTTAKWNGTTWSTLPSPNPINASFTVLDGVACISATNCIAVGNVMSTPGHNNTLVQHWDGTSWTILTSPNPPGATISQLAGVSCPSTTNCVAVGRYTTSTSATAADIGPFRTLVEQWNGSTWSIATSPNPTGASFARLDRVSCTAVNNCMAIGVSSTTTTGTDVALAERWDGTAWSIVPSATLSFGGNTFGLSGISCVGATRCVAVYSYSPGRAPGWESYLLTEQWDGTKWSSAPSSDHLTAFDETLSGVSCTSATVCMVTGAYTNWLGASEVATATLAEQVNGSDWTVVDSGRPPGAHPRLDAVSCTTAAGCVAVGAQSPTQSSFDPPVTLTEQWDGTAWTVVTSPNPAGAAASELVSVSCATPTNCLAVGDFQVASTGETRPLAEQWNGSAWTIVAQ